MHDIEVRRCETGVVGEDGSFQIGLGVRIRLRGQAVAADGPETPQLEDPLADDALPQRVGGVVVLVEEMADQLEVADEAEARRRLAEVVGREIVERLLLRLAGVLVDGELAGIEHRQSEKVVVADAGREIGVARRRPRPAGDG
jgi:hypothetical protein